MPNEEVHFCCAPLSLQTSEGNVNMQSFIDIIYPVGLRRWIYDKAIIRDKYNSVTG